MSLAEIKAASERCDVCGKFRRSEQLREMEHRELGDEYGHLRETWWLECDFCRAGGRA